MFYVEYDKEKITTRTIIYISKSGLLTEQNREFQDQRNSQEEASQLTSQKLQTFLVHK